MKITIIATSNRADPQSSRIAKLIHQQFAIQAHAEYEDVNLDILDFSSQQIPQWDESIWAGKWTLQPQWQPISEQLATSDGFIFVVPEWSGMAPPILKNFFLLINNELANKPCLLVTISSGMGGSYPIAELRMSSFKNTHLLWIPDQVIIRKCEDFAFNLLGHELHEFVAKRLTYSYAVLVEYAKRLQGLNDKLKDIGASKHKYGM